MKRLLIVNYSLHCSEKLKADYMKKGFDDVFILNGNPYSFLDVMSIGMMYKNCYPSCIENKEEIIRSFNEKDYFIILTEEPCLASLVMENYLKDIGLKECKQEEKKPRPKIIAVDFDGTLCIDRFPEIGEPKEKVISYVKSQQANGAKLILWTNRVGEKLADAITWCRDKHGISFDAVNCNLPEIIEFFGGDPRKVFANEYLDDRSKNPDLL